MLSQLAGEEIERLLAEAQAKPAGTISPVATSTPDNQQAVQSAAAAVDSAEKTDPPVAQAVAQPVLAPAQAADTPPADTSTGNKPPPPVASKQTPTAETPSQQKSEQKSPIPQPAPAAAPPAEPHADASEHPPLYLRVLLAINAPLVRCPDNLRNALGAIAILTLLNSLGVLVYVLLFRR